MFSGEIFSLVHSLVNFLMWPVIGGLLIFSIGAILECGIAAGEYWRGLDYLKQTAHSRDVEKLGRKRIERADILTRVAPMLGLMGTLIPLGPGLAALGQGNIILLSSAVTVAFDTTVLGLFTGILGFVISRLRRRWYDTLLDQMTESSSP